MDDEFLEYCKLNNIEDVEKYARSVFNQGFTIVKYGKEPLTQHILMVDVSPSAKKPDISPEIIEHEVVVPKGIKKQMEQDQIQNMKKKADLYDE